MKNKLVYGIVLGLFVSACGGLTQGKKKRKKGANLPECKKELVAEFESITAHIEYVNKVIADKGDAKSYSDGKAVNKEKMLKELDAYTKEAKGFKDKHKGVVCKYFVENKTDGKDKEGKPVIVKEAKEFNSEKSFAEVDKKAEVLKEKISNKDFKGY